MKILSTILLVFLSCAIFYAQDKKITFDDGTIIDLSADDENLDCIGGDSNNYAFRKGKVTKIINGRTFIFSVDDEFENETYKVVLAGIDMSSNSSMLKKLLIENLLNQTVMVIGEEIKEGSKKILGEVIPTERNKLFIVNRYFLKNGLAKYVEPKMYLVPNYTLCEYRKIAKQAKEAKVGIWAK